MWTHGHSQKIYNVDTNQYNLENSEISYHKIMRSKKMIRSKYDVEAQASVHLPGGSQARY